MRTYTRNAITTLNQIVAHACPVLLSDFYVADNWRSNRRLVMMRRALTHELSRRWIEYETLDGIEIVDASCPPTPPYRPVSADTIADVLGVSRPTAIYYLRTLENQDATP